MSEVLLVASSLFGETSKSREVALDFLNAWRGAHPGSHVTIRDANTISHFSGYKLGALMTAPEKRTPEQRAAVTDALGEVEAANMIVLAVTQAYSPSSK
jgi:FMN-dependent NADH-azoreductase